MVKFTLLAILVLLGHVGWWLFCYNRLNSTALPRRWIKRAEIAIIALVPTIPTLIVISHWPLLMNMLQGEDVNTLTPWLMFWMVWSLCSLLVLGPIWLESRIPSPRTIGPIGATGTPRRFSRKTSATTAKFPV